MGKKKQMLNDVANREQIMETRGEEEGEKEGQSSSSSTSPTSSPLLRFRPSLTFYNGQINKLLHLCPAEERKKKDGEDEEGG